MRMSNFAAEDVFGFLAEQESGMRVSEICQKYGIGESAFFDFKSKFQGMTISQIGWIRSLENENKTLKRENKKVAQQLEVAKDFIKKKL